MKKYRHGDVLLKQISSLPAGLQKKADLTVAYGEVTGHHHRFFDGNVQLYSNPQSGVVYADVSAPSPLIHEEHRKIIIDPGVYEISGEREFDYSEEELKSVVD